MNVLEQQPLVTLLAGVLAGALTLAAGVALGLAIAWRRGWHSASPSLTGEQSEQLVQALLQWTNSLVSDVDQCREQMAMIQHDVLSADADVQQSPEMFVDMMTQMVQANAQMRQRLALAEDSLSAQAKRIAQTLNEARTDVLTGLPNRRMFEEELARRHAEFTRYGVTFSLLMFDIDHFKRFNDAYGHLAGDEVLRSLARIVGHTLRETDILARLGGEEFAVIFASTDGRDSHTAAERARLAIAAASINYEQQPLRVTVSCGLAEPLPGETSQDLMRRSDEALYASKASGRNCGHWHNGEYCLSLATQSTHDRGKSVYLPIKSDRELAEACDALRQRLLEVTAGI